jgi:tetratricopeptide (TPR) repeat protein
MYSYIADACHSNNDFEEAIQYYENAIEMELTCDPPNMENIAHNYGCIAIIYNDLENSIMAIKNFEKAIEFALKSANGNQLMELYFNMATTYTEKGYQDEALHTFNLLLQQVGDLTSPDGLTVASTYYCISKIYYDRKEYSLSIDNIKKAIEVGTVYSLSDEFMIHYYVHLAEGYLNNDELDKAIDNFELSIRIEENFVTPNLISVAKKYNRLGRIYFTKGDYETSLYYLKEKGLALRLAYLTPDHVDIGRSYNNIGKVLASKRDYDQALDLYKQAIDIFSQSGSDADSANTYKNLSELYESEKKYTDALAYAEKAFEFGERSLPSNSQTLVQYSARVTAAKNKIISSSIFLRCLALILSQSTAFSIIFKSKI